MPDAADRPVLGAVGQAVACLGKALTEDVWRLQGPELGAVLEGLDELRRGTERLTIAGVSDAAERGVASDEGFSSVTDYVTGHAPSLGVGEANQFVKVAKACQEGKNAALAQAVASGEVPVRKGFQVVGALDKIDPFVGFEDYQQRLAELMATALGGTDADLRRQVRDIIDQSRPPVDSDVFAGKQHQARSLTEHAAGGGMTEFRWRLGPGVRHSSKPRSDHCPNPNPMRTGQTCAPPRSGGRTR